MSWVIYRVDSLNTNTKSAKAKAMVLFAEQFTKARFMTGMCFDAFVDAVREFVAALNEKWPQGKPYRVDLSTQGVIEVIKEGDNNTWKSQYIVRINYLMSHKQYTAAFFKSKEFRDTVEMAMKGGAQ